MQLDDDVMQKLLDLNFFASNFFKLRSKDGSIIDFKFNKAQQYLHRRLQAQLDATGKIRAVVLKGRQQGCCFSPDMRVLTADYRWIPIGEIKLGERLVACDEYGVGRTSCGREQSRKFRTATVEAKREFYKPTFEILFDNGALLNVTGDHRMLCKKRGADNQQWRHVQDFKIGDFVRIATRPPNYECLSYEDGWMGGMIDGEGSSRINGAKRISVHQVAGAVLDRMRRYFESIEIPYKEVVDLREDGINKKGRKPCHRFDVHRLPYIIELFARCRPTRFTNAEWHVGHELPGKAAKDGIRPWAKIIKITPLQKQKVIDLQTSEKTFICEGLVSHNSTYVQARYLHKTITNRGYRTYILTHETEATKNLFGITKRYYDNLPDGLCPKADRDTQDELIFEKTLGSSYGVGTARNRGAGRSQTIQLLHGSEVAFWEHAQEHATGLLQAVGNTRGTEIILESTANGIGNYFYNMWRAASGGESDWQAIFLPWYWQDEYKDYAPGFMLSEEENELMSRYAHDGLTKEHLAWRRKKINDFGYDWDAGVAEFRQEFPFNALEAFRNPVDDVFINAQYVQRARNNDVYSDNALVIGVDPAIGENDRCVIMRRKGRVAFGIESLVNHNTMELAGRLKRLIESEHPQRVFIDSIGIGAGTVDRLKEMGFAQVIGVNVARSANDKIRFANLRAELWWEMRDWFYQNDLPVQVPDSDELEQDLCGLGYKYRSNGQLLIESKADAKSRGLRSPDMADALMLTFAEGQTVNVLDSTVLMRPKTHNAMFT